MQADVLGKFAVPQRVIEALHRPDLSSLDALPQRYADAALSLSSTTAVVVLPISHLIAVGINCATLRHPFPENNGRLIGKRAAITRLLPGATVLIP
jgi:hypothetical protein